MRKSSRSNAAAGRRPDRRRLLRAAQEFLAAIGETGLRPDTRRTPQRVADAWSRELLAGYGADPGAILATAFAGPARDMVLVRDIPFTSVCAHHLLPFHGTAHVAYLPAGRIVGLSKIARAVDALARRLQLQERLTRQVVTALDRAVRPRGVACWMEAEHLCMTVRGAGARGSAVVTAAYSGRFERSAALRSEFQRAAGVGRAIGTHAGGRRAKRRRTAAGRRRRR